MKRYFFPAFSYCDFIRRFSSKRALRLHLGCIRIRVNWQAP